MQTIKCGVSRFYRSSRPYKSPADHTDPADHADTPIEMCTSCRSHIPPFRCTDHTGHTDSTQADPTDPAGYTDPADL